MSDKIAVQGLKIDNNLYQFVNDEVLPQTGIEPDDFWRGFASTAHRLIPENKALLAKRTELQKKIDTWLIENKSRSYTTGDYQKFLEDIGYLVPEGDDFSITTENTDDEIALVAGPQLVVPVLNARFLLNAANARWGSLYDALYGTDVIPQDGNKSKEYNVARGAKVIAWAREHLDKTAPLDGASHHDAVHYQIVDGGLVVTLGKGETVRLTMPHLLCGWRGDVAIPEAILLKVNGLHLEIVIDKNGVIGRNDKAGINDILIESALTTIVDLEDSVAAVDAEDKILAYRNWLGVMKGDLTAVFDKNGKTITRALNSDRHYIAANGTPLVLPGRSLLLVRNVGLLMNNPAILDADDNEIPEGIMDAFISAAIALHDLHGLGVYRNSRAGSMYIVKPKLHGPEETAFTDRLFTEVEEVLGLTQNTLKIGIMDEERRTSVNLKECIRAAKNRVVFINTGFLDRTGDEIHTSMEAGAMIPKTTMKQSVWINAYEDWNVDIGLACGLSGKAQIGKGMWAMPDLMARMMDEKIAHPKSGANCAWVPSPTAATLHALHYHQINVLEIQRSFAGKRRAQLDDLLTIPVDHETNHPPEVITHELENNAQGILGYVVRWIDHGIGCSKVPDINDIGLMEDRATLRISSQHIANWLHHNIVTHDQVMIAMRRMAKIVDLQNEDDPEYQPMAADFDHSIAFKAACDLVFDGRAQPSGYTEPILHRRRLEMKMSERQ